MEPVTNVTPDRCPCPCHAASDPARSIEKHRLCSECIDDDMELIRALVKREFDGRELVEEMLNRLEGQVDPMFVIKARKWLRDS